MQQFDAIWINANIATMTDNGVPYGAIENGVLAIKDGLIAFVGKRGELPGFDAMATPLHDMQGQWILPGFIDCHTHLIYA